MKSVLKLQFYSLLLAFFVSASGASAQDATQVEVFKSPQCGCCGKWIEHLQQNGFQVNVHEVNDVPSARKELGMPDRLGSCHTAKVGDYVIEGHVPAADIQRLLKEKPKALGLAVPSMPPGSPGMETANPIPHNTLLVETAGSTRIFDKH